MGLTAYLPLEAVYAFHENAETWILRRYAATVLAGSGAERTRGDYVEGPVAVFRDRSSKSTQNLDRGQVAPQTCTAYTRTRLVTSDDVTEQDSDVLFDPATGDAWEARSRGDWDEARGYAVTLARVGRRGVHPWA